MMWHGELNPADEAAIRAQTRRMTSAWARGDAVGYAAVCTDDATYVTASGTRLVGRDAITRAHREVFDGPLRGTILELDREMDLRAVTPDVVLVHATGSVQFPAGDASPARAVGVLSLVAVADDGTWRFASFSNTPIARDARL